MRVYEYVGVFVGLYYMYNKYAQRTYIHVYTKRVECENLIAFPICRLMLMLVLIHLYEIKGWRGALCDMNFCGKINIEKEGEKRPNKIG